MIDNHQTNKKLVVSRKISFVDETNKIVRRITKDIKPKNKFRLRKTMVDDKLLKNYFVFENSTKAENELTTYRIDKASIVEKQIVSSQIQVIATTYTEEEHHSSFKVNQQSDNSNVMNHLWNKDNQENQDNLSLLLLLLISLTSSTNQ